jgi:hypothetical protein
MVSVRASAAAAAHRCAGVLRFDHVRARHVREQTNITHTWYSFNARAD